MKKLIRETIADGVSFSVVRDDRFKNDSITAVFYLPLSADTVSEYAMLTRVLTRTCEKYPDYTVLSKKISALYGASVFGTCMKVGDRMALAFGVEGIDDKYALNGEKLSAEMSELLCELLFRPNLNGEAFQDEDLEQGKRELFDSIDSELNEKRVYAVNKAISVMCAGEAYAIPRFGTKAGAEAVTAASLFRAWKQLLKTAVTEIVYVGESDPKLAKEAFQKYFAETDRSPAAIGNTVVRRADEVKTASEEMELSQSKMILGFRTDCAEPDEDVTATRLMCAALGGTAHSKLFNNVREKLSLCYYCASRYNRQKGILTVESGVELENIEKAKKAILNEIEDMKKGNITDFEIESAKMSVVNSFKETDDTVSSIASWYIGQTFDRTVMTSDEASEKILAVTKDDIVRAANRLTLDTVYTLKGISTEGDAE